MKRHTLWIIELVIWFLVIFITAFGINIYKAVKENPKNTYHIFIKDVDGLMKGSPVKIMGIQVGYITEINVVDDYVYVSFLISKEGVKIPHGSSVVIESYGVAGSKSIELYPPKNKTDESQAVLYVNEPIRTNSSYNSQGSIARNLIAISENTSAKLSTRTTRQHQQNIEKFAELTQKIEFNKIDDTADKLMKKMEENAKRREEVHE